MKYTLIFLHHETSRKLIVSWYVMPSLGFISKPSAYGNFSTSPAWSRRLTTGCGTRELPCGSTGAPSDNCQEMETRAGRVTSRDSLSSTVLSPAVRLGESVCHLHLVTAP